MRLSNRRISFKSPKQPILIVCEDEKSSVVYLRDKIKDMRISPVDVEVDGGSGSAPISVVEYAVARKRQQKREAQRLGKEEYAVVYCVMDVDDHPTIRQAIVKAKDNDLISIVSNQCFELWYLLHFMEYSTAFLHRDEIYNKLSERIGEKYEKSSKNMYALLKRTGSETHAVALAKRLHKAAEDESDEINPLRNPSTEVFHLIEKLNSL